MAIHFGANEHQTAPLLRPAPSQPVGFRAGQAIFGRRAHSRRTPNFATSGLAGQQRSRSGGACASCKPAEVAAAPSAPDSIGSDARSVAEPAGTLLSPHAHRTRSGGALRLDYAARASAGRTPTRPAGATMCAFGYVVS